MTDRQQRIEALEWALGRAIWSRDAHYVHTLRVMLGELQECHDCVDGVMTLWDGGDKYSYEPCPNCKPTIHRDSAGEGQVWVTEKKD